jgi:hypothetical protein
MIDLGDLGNWFTRGRGLRLSRQKMELGLDQLASKSVGEKASPNF